MALLSMPNFNFFSNQTIIREIWPFLWNKVKMQFLHLLSFQQIRGCMEAIHRGIVSDHWSYNWSYNNVLNQMAAPPKCANPNPDSDLNLDSELFGLASDSDSELETE